VIQVSTDLAKLFMVEVEGPSEGHLEVSLKVNTVHTEQVSIRLLHSDLENLTSAVEPPSSIPSSIKVS